MKKQGRLARLKFQTNWFAHRLHDAGTRFPLWNPEKPILLALLCFCNLTMARALTVTSTKTGISVRLNEKTGRYQIAARNPAWSFAGSLGSAPHALRKVRGRDRIGAFQEIAFTWHSGQVPLRSVIRLYLDHPLLLFRYMYLKPSNPSSVAFPSFTSMPVHLYHFSYRNAAFAPPQFELGQYGTPWLFFDRNANAMVISPASHFIIAAMHGNGEHLIASGLNNKLSSVPAGFTQQTLMAIAPGIRHTWHIWGDGLIRLEGKLRPANESDTVLKYYGYWTDHGAFYYYKNYNPKLGYAGTLKAVIAQYRKEGIPVHYLQLDSWWYDKSFKGMSPDDHTGRWSAGGGEMLYRASPTLFPQGLRAFQRSVDLPLMTHGRWISEHSPYRQTYQISGVAAIGMKWWNHIAAYLQSNGVVTYEQDWQSYIDQHSPAFNSTIQTGKEFYDHMARACRAHGLTMQYCMALPCDFLQGSRYGNLASIRVSDDRFMRKRWRNFLYTSQLAYAIGTWPWTDVYFSNETDNLLLGDLSAGPVGTGDALGKEDKANILKAVRADGVIVKPDEPIMPLDQMYIADANHSKTPFIGSTWTDDGAVRTAYVFAFSRSGSVSQTVRFSPKEVGVNGPAYVFDYFNHNAQRVARGGTFATQLGPNGTGYYIVAPVGESGITFFGDSGNFVTMGKQRIASLVENCKLVDAQVLFAANENSVMLFGYAPSKPTVAIREGHAGPVSFTQNTGYFSVEVSPQMSTKPVKLDGNLVRRVSVTFRR